MLRSVPSETVHLWFAFPEEWDERALAAEVRGCLDAAEIARMERMRFPEGRRLFAVSHLLVRRALAHDGGRLAGEWRFVDDGHGKPAIDPGLGVPGLHFNLSHTRGMAVVAVTRLGPVGVDIEREDRRVDARALIRRFFADSERASLEALPPERLRRGFFLLWTLKEAALKAAGQGLLLPLTSVEFRLTGRRPYRIASGRPDRKREVWRRFAVIEPRKPYLAAICVECDSAAPLKIVARRLAPSGTPEPLACTPVAVSPGVVLTEG
jgi:4'-phosphopantetheinyl transferase